jgi:hypothetical protein
MLPPGWVRTIAALFVVALRVYSACGQHPLILGFTLIDSSTKAVLRPVENGDQVNVRADYANVPLTIRVNVAQQGETSIPWVRIVWNDGVGNTEREPPYYLAGDHDGDVFEATALQQVGTHTIDVAVLDETLSEVEELSIKFSIVDSAEEVAPTATTATPPLAINDVAGYESSQVVDPAKEVAPSATAAAPLSINDVAGYESSQNGTIHGELKLWHKVTIGFTGMLTGETNKTVNSFTDLRLDVTFEHQASGKRYIVPGFYACDGDAANTGGSSGFVWLVR